MDLPLDHAVGFSEGSQGKRFLFLFDPAGEARRYLLIADRNAVLLADLAFDPQFDRLGLVSRRLGKLDRSDPSHLVAELLDIQTRPNRRVAVDIRGSVWNKWPRQLGLFATKFDDCRAWPTGSLGG